MVEVVLGSKPVKLMTAADPEQIDVACDAPVSVSGALTVTDTSLEIIELPQGGVVLQTTSHEPAPKLAPVGV